MKKNQSFFSFLLAAVILFSAIIVLVIPKLISPAVPVPATNPLLAAGWKTYSDYRYKFSVGYPSGWYFENTNFEAVRFIKNSCEKNCPIIRIAVEDNSKAYKTAEDWWKNSVWNGRGESVALAVKKTFRINNLVAYQVLEPGDKKYNIAPYSATYLVRSNNIYSVTALFGPEKPDLFAVYNQILSSLKFPK